MLEEKSNYESIGRRKVALRRAIEVARHEIPLKAASEKEAQEMLDALYAALPAIEQPSLAERK